MPTNSPSESPRPAALAFVLGGLAFAVAATLNAGGYRYGASDQAFYIPAILHHVDPSLFPRDWAMLGAQGRYFLVDEVSGTLVRLTSWSLATWFAYGGYFHFRLKNGLRRPRALAVLLWVGLLFVVLTLTWINVSRLFSGMHTYA